MTWGTEDILNIMISEVDGNEEESSERLGLLYSFQGFGCLVGPVLANTFLIDASRPRTLQSTCILSFSIVVMGWIGISYSPTFEIICFFTFIRCVGSSILWLNSTLLLQNLTSTDMLGRVLSYDSSLASLAQSLTAYVSGKMEDTGYGKGGIARLSAVLGIFSFTFWSIYHVCGMGAAQKGFDADNDNQNSKKEGIELIYSPGATV